MNKTFKVVFNRARHGLMVANEITSSIQKKGTKSVLAAAAVSALVSGLALVPATSAFAAFSGGDYDSYDDYTGVTQTGNAITVTGETVTKNILGAVTYRLPASISDNSVAIAESSAITGDIHGGVAYVSGDASVSKNTLTVSASKVISKSSDIFYGSKSSISGGYSYLTMVGNATAAINYNSVKVLDNSEITSDVYGGRVFGKPASSAEVNLTATLTENSVAVSESTVTGSVFGSHVNSEGTKTAAITIKNSNVTISESSITGSGIYGGYAFPSASGVTGEVTISDSSVTISDSESVEASIYGGFTYVAGSSATATLSGNTVSVTNSTVTGDVYGGTASTEVSSGTVSTARVSDSQVALSSSATVNGDVYGSKAYAYYANEAAIASSTSGVVSVSDNSVVNGNIYGAYAEAAGSETLSNASATNNIVSIDGATVKDGAAVYGGYVKSSGVATATNNVVNIAGDYTVTGVSLYGGYADESSGDVFTGNTLNLDARNGSSTSVAKVANFATINIQASDVSSGNTILATTGTTLGNDTAGTTVNLVSVGSGSELSANDTITLISTAEGTLANDGQSQFVSKGGSFADGYNAQISLTDGSVVATVLGAAANPETKVLNEARVASQAFINSGTDLLLDTSIEGGAFGAIRGGHSRYKTGSSAEIDGVNLVAGLAHTFAGKSGDTTGGVFFEAGWGDTTTHNTIGGKSLKGSGDTHYYGAGLLARYEQKEGAAKGLYADAAFRVGRLSNDYHNNDARNLSGERVSFDIGSTYYAAHVGVGYKWDLTNSLRLDTSAQYMWSHVDSKNVAILGDSYHFDSMNSHRTRVGVKLDYTGAKNYTPYIGLAWEHEFKGEAKASVQGNAVDKADLGGSSGIVTLGVDFKPSENSPFIFNAGFVGHFGEHKGAAGQLMMQYKF